MYTRTAMARHLRPIAAVALLSGLAAAASLGAEVTPDPKGSLSCVQPLDIGVHCTIAPDAGSYNGFNLLLGDGAGLFYLSNRAAGVRRLEPGVYGLSNALLDTPWPKVLRAREAVADALARAEGDAWDSTLWEMLADRVIAADDALPDTGVGAERERLLSPPFIRTDVYGTRASTVVTITHGGAVHFVERSVVPDQEGWTESRHAFRIGEGGEPPT